MSERRDIWSILVKPTNACNLDCQYCYDKPLREKYKGKKMTIEIVDKIAKLASEYSKKVIWVWHGGEPTLMGADWYRNVQNIFYKYYNTDWVQQMQSNGLLLNDDKWIKLASDYKINIGVSFDAFTQYVRLGSENIDLSETIKIFKNAGLSPGSISVINNENYKRQIELYEYFKNKYNDYSVAFNHIYRTDGSLANKLEVSAEKYANEYKKYYEYWLYDRNGIEERSVCNMTTMVISGKGQTCTESDCRREWIGVNSTGDIYPCDRYVGEKYYMGNIMDYNSIEEIYKSDGFIKYFNEITERFNKHCNECGYFEICKGGCNANHIAVENYETASGIDEFSCELFRKKFNIVYNILREIDIYDNRLNIIFIRMALEQPFITINEINECLVEKGYKKLKKEQDLKNSKEFKVFKLFNQYENMDINGHCNFIKHSLERDVSITKDFEMETLRKNRKKVIEDIYKANETKIKDILVK